LKRVLGFGFVPAVALLATGLIIALSFVVLQRLVGENRERAISEAVKEARLVATGIVMPHVDQSGPRGPVKQGRSATIDQALRHYLGETPSPISTVQVLGRSGTPLYSYGAGAVTSPATQRRLGGALRGKTVMTVTGESTESDLEVLVPLGEQPSGSAVRVLMPYDDVLSQARSQASTLYLLVGELALVLATVLALLLCFYRMAQSLRSQSAANVHQALHDELTGLPNRTLFRDRTEQAISRARRSGDRAAVMIMDLDRFKEVNDTLGHHLGDLLLQEVGKRMRERLREVDTIARFGGDEFAILLEKVEHPGAALDIANKIRSAVSEPLVLGDFELSVDASIGIAFYPAHATDFNRLLQRADIAMYSAKTGGTGCELYVAERDHYSPDRLALAHALKGAIDTDELRLHYQPKVDMRSGTPGSVEALVRWQHPALGMVGPDEFIPVAEQAGLMGRLTDWVMNEALRQARKWSAEGLDIPIAINMSVRNLADRDLAERISFLLRKYSVPATSLELEITESAIMDDPALSVETVRKLRALGCKVTIDDFGTGQSSLAYLHKLPVTGLKIDKSLVANMLASDGDMTIVRSTIDLGRNLGLEVVAEGVEDEATWVALRDLGCQFAQGYWSGRSTPAEQLPWLLRLVEAPALA
jgi:diguanylate cyclase (GGDEF)-like protein